MVTATARPAKQDAQDDRGSIVFGGNLRIPAGIADLESFRHWARSEGFPERGEIDWLGGVLWVDLEMEQAYTHNRVKTQILRILDEIVTEKDAGYLFSDGMRFSHPVADVSSEPDAMFISFEALETGAIREIPALDGGVIEFEGSPDMVLEVVSDSSITKDTDRLMDLYFLAGIKEYWLVDVRGASVEFEIHKRGSKGFVAARRQGNKRRSVVFGCSFQLSRDSDRRGNPRYTLSIM